MNKQPFTPEQFKEIYSKVPRLCVELIIETPDGIVLTLRKLPTWNNMWHFPGGTVFYKETIRQAVDRVATEELGIFVEVKKPLGYIEYPSEDKERGFGWSVGLAILCEIKSGDLRVNEQASDIKIFSKLPENMVSEQKDFLEKNNLLEVKY